VTADASQRGASSISMGIHLGRGEWAASGQQIEPKRVA
jgi:hypothetical protein